jgi:hypothetical protein
MIEQNQANFEETLTTHNCLKRSTILPLVCANASKDAISGHCLIERMEIAAEIANWDHRDHSKPRERMSLCTVLEAM